MHGRSCWNDINNQMVIEDDIMEIMPACYCFNFSLIQIVFVPVRFAHGKMQNISTFIDNRLQNQISKWNNDMLRHCIHNIHSVFVCKPLTMRHVSAFSGFLSYYFKENHGVIKMEQNPKYMCLTLSRQWHGDARGLAIGLYSVCLFRCCAEGVKPNCTSAQ